MVYVILCLLLFWSLASTFAIQVPEQRESGKVGEDFNDVTEKREVEEEVKRTGSTVLPDSRVVDLVCEL